MAVTIQNITDGPRNVIVKLTIAAANADAVVVDASALSGADTIKQLTLVEAQWSLIGDVALLEWDAATDVVLLDCTVGNGGMIFDPGIPNNAGSGKTGDVLLTNSASLTSGEIYLKFKKY